MKRRSTLMTCLFLLLGIASLHAAYTTPQSGKVYRIHNGKSDKVIGEDGIARELVSVDAAANDFKQLWLLQESGSGYLVQNAYSGQYLQPCAQQSTQIYPTSTEQTPMYIKLVSGTGYSIGQAQNAYLHLDNGNNIVRWWDASNAASQWHFEEVTISAEAMSLQQAAFQAFYEEYQAKLELINHIDEYSDGTTERGRALRKSICDKFGFASLEFQSLEGVVKSIGLPPEKLCTYCWNGKE